nr:PREDICTED: coiled-coil domain-containing protein 137 [Bemisia tabaci]XP_018904609.1 PREDICTED: coiled-coil domain-containing protein 137 [Bemisia tabaci]
MKTKKLKQIGNYKYKKHEKKKFGAHSKKKANYRAEKLEMKQLKKKLDKKDQKKKGKESADKPKVELPELSGKKLKNYKIAQKKKAKKEKEKMKKIEKREDAVLNAKDHVEFGEVVHGPPELTSRPRGMEAPVNDQRNGLLLLEKFQTSMDKRKCTNASSSSVFGKRQKLSKERLKELEDERNRVINSYRSMKSKRKPETNIRDGPSEKKYKLHSDFGPADDV